jgi:hypothetical protein
MKVTASSEIVSECWYNQGGAYRRLNQLKLMCPVKVTVFVAFLVTAGMYMYVCMYVCMYVGMYVPGLAQLQSGQLSNMLLSCLQKNTALHVHHILKIYGLPTILKYNFTYITFTTLHMHI